MIRLKPELLKWNTDLLTEKDLIITFNREPNFNDFKRLIKILENGYKIKDKSIKATRLNLNN